MCATIHPDRPIATTLAAASAAGPKRRRLACPPRGILPTGPLGGGSSACAGGPTGGKAGLVLFLVMAACSRPARAATWAALAGRARGSLAVRSSTSAAASRGTEGGSGGSGCCWWASITAIGWPVNGGWPVRHWKATMPRAYRSAAGVAAAPRARSGAK